MSHDYTKWSQEQLIHEIRKLKKNKKFGLVWEDKPEDVAVQCQTKLPVLEEDSKRAITGVQDAPTNLIIEGDNYHALSILNYTHAGKIDVIYIDPPYNTGATDWKYNNNYIDLNDTYRHSKWLSLMKNRLKLSKALLKPDGVLILTIDDNELFHIGTLLEEMFPAHEIFIVTIEHNKRGRRGKNFAKTNEWALFLVPKGMDRILEEESEIKLGGETRNLRRTGSGSKRVERPRKFYPIWVNTKTLKVVRADDPIAVDTQWQPETNGDLVNVWPVDAKGREKNWHYGIERTRECIEKGELEARKQEYGMQVYYTLREKTSKKYKTVWTGAELDASSHGSVLLEKILGEAAVFDYPKSIYAVLECMKATVGDRQDAIILDYFAGSGTTGHAVLELNKMDGGNRQFILVTNNENGIAEKVTYPRVKSIIKGYGDVAGISANLRYFKTGFVNKEQSDDQTRAELIGKCSEMICIRESSFDAIIQQDGYVIYQGSRHYTAILFNPDSIEKLKNELNNLDEEYAVHIYLFSLSGDTYESDFEDIQHVYEICPIPESILEVYRRIFINEQDNVAAHD